MATVMINSNASAGEEIDQRFRQISQVFVAEIIEATSFVVRLESMYVNEVYPEFRKEISKWKCEAMKYEKECKDGSVGWQQKMQEHRQEIKKIRLGQDLEKQVLEENVRSVLKEVELLHCGIQALSCPVTDEKKDRIDQVDAPQGDRDGTRHGGHSVSHEHQDLVVDVIFEEEGKVPPGCLNLKNWSIILCDKLSHLREVVQLAGAKQKTLQAELDEKRTQCTTLKQEIQQLNLFSAGLARQPEDSATLRTFMNLSGVATHLSTHDVSRANKKLRGKCVSEIKSSVPQKLSPVQRSTGESVRQPKELLSLDVNKFSPNIACLHEHSSLNQEASSEDPQTRSVLEQSAVQERTVNFMNVTPSYSSEKTFAGKALNNEAYVEPAQIVSPSDQVSSGALLPLDSRKVQRQEQTTVTSPRDFLSNVSSENCERNKLGSRSSKATVNRGLHSAKGIEQCGTLEFRWNDSKFHYAAETPLAGEACILGKRREHSGSTSVSNQTTLAESQLPDCAVAQMEEVVTGIAWCTASANANAGEASDDIKARLGVEQHVSFSDQATMEASQMLPDGVLVEGLGTPPLQNACLAEIGKKRQSERAGTQEHFWGSKAVCDESFQTKVELEQSAIPVSKYQSVKDISSRAPEAQAVSEFSTKVKDMSRRQELCLHQTTMDASQQMELLRIVPGADGHELVSKEVVEEYGRYSAPTTARKPEQVASAGRQVEDMVNSSLSPIKTPPTNRKESAVHNYSAGHSSKLKLWRKTRHRVEACEADPHDSFLDTPRENALLAIAERRDLTNMFQVEEAAEASGGLGLSEFNGFVPDTFSLEGQISVAQQQQDDPTVTAERSHPEVKEREGLGQASTSSKLQRSFDTSERIRNQLPASTGNSKAPPYKYVDTVRKRKDRENLQGTDCKQCTAFYKAMLDGDGDGILSNICEHHDAVSRHRFRYIPPATPKGFWDIGFDSGL